MVVRGCNALIAYISWGEMYETCSARYLSFRQWSGFLNMLLFCKALNIFIWVQVTSSWHLSTQKSNEASFFRARTTPFQVVRSISTTIQITVLVMGYFKVWMGENIFRVEFSECVFFLPLKNMTVIETEKKKRKSYSSSTSFCTQRKVNYMEASILGSTAWTWGFSLCPFITFCWLASPSCNIPTVLTGKMLTHAWL